MGSIVASLMPVSTADALAQIASVSAQSDLVEIRADLLDRDAVRSIVGRSGCETIVTVRRVEEGGRFDGSEAEREALLRDALEAGTRWVDVELDGTLSGWADGPHADRVILSQHGVRCLADELAAVLSRMASTRAARFKIVAELASVAETVAVRDLLDRARDPRLCAFGLSAAGAVSRIFALAWGSWGTYGAAQRGVETAPGQFPVDQLRSVFAVRELSASTRVAALVGRRLVPGSPSPAMHNAGYRAAELDRVYVPLECENWTEAATLSAALGWSELAVTIPFKTIAAECSSSLDEISAAARAVNTLIHGHGFNTDGPAAVDCLQHRGARVGDSIDILGAGGTARAIAVALAVRGYRPTVWSRSGELPAPVPGVSSQLLADRLPGRSDWLVNATPVVDASLLGEGPPARKGVLEAVYGSTRSALLARAAAAGLVGVDGLELLVAQAEQQFQLHTGQAPAAGLFANVGGAYLTGLD